MIRIEKYLAVILLMTFLSGCVGLQTQSANSEPDQSIATDYDARYFKQSDGDLGSLVQSTPYKNDPTSMDSVSIAAWVKHNGQAFKNWETILSKGDSSFRLHLNGGCNIAGDIDSRNVQHGITFGLHGGCSQADLNSNVVPVKDQWYHVAGVYDGTSMTIYIDGKKVNEANINKPVKLDHYQLQIGENEQRPGRNWNGEIRSAAIWGTPISQTLIEQHMNTTNPIKKQEIAEKKDKKKKQGSLFGSHSTM